MRTELNIQGLVPLKPRFKGAPSSSPSLWLMLPDQYYQLSFLPRVGTFWSILHRSTRRHPFSESHGRVVRQPKPCGAWCAPIPTSLPGIAQSSSHSSGLHFHKFFGPATSFFLFLSLRHHQHTNTTIILPNHPESFQASLASFFAPTTQSPP